MGHAKAILYSPQPENGFCIFKDLFKKYIYVAEIFTIWPFTYLLSVPLH